MSIEPHNEEKCMATQTQTQSEIVKPLHQLAVTAGEEQEHLLLLLKAKLYRFDKEGNQWKERGNGTVKLLKHEDTQKVRLVMRQSKTLKICASHLVLPSLSVQVHAGNSKACVWHATDFSDGNLKEELFCIRFGSRENCKAFREMIEEVAKSQQKTISTVSGEDATSTVPNDTVEEVAKFREVEESEEALTTGNQFEKSSVEQSNNQEEERQEASYLYDDEEWVIV